MDIFLTLFLNLIPLYVLIGLGFIAGRYLKVESSGIATLTIFIFVPIMMFGFIIDMKLRAAYMALPIIFFICQAIVAMMFLKIGQHIYKDKKANLLSICASSGNSGYFGLPVALLVFPENIVSAYVFTIIGGVIFEATVIYYLAARGSFDIKQSLIKLAKFPAIYAVVAAFIVKFADAELPEQFWTYWEYFKGAYVVAGMMIIGLALSKLKKFELGPRFLSTVFAGKFIIWPFLAYSLVMLDSHVLNLFNEEAHKILLLLSILPPAANTTAFATQMNLEPEKAATTILISTIFALFYIPMMIGLFGI
ncbi:MAG: hypothetical protein GC137_04135 [Alphaproteobacteria bacterium]|nr:hypothetical protein [Alphaproteobacteria bacterium]